MGTRRRALAREPTAEPPATAHPAPLAPNPTEARAPGKPAPCSHPSALPGVGPVSQQHLHMGSQGSSQNRHLGHVSLLLPGQHPLPLGQHPDSPSATHGPPRPALHPSPAPCPAATFHRCRSPTRRDAVPARPGNAGFLSHASPSSSSDHLPKFPLPRGGVPGPPGAPVCPAHSTKLGGLLLTGC